MSDKKDKDIVPGSLTTSTSGGNDDEGVETRTENVGEVEAAAVPSITEAYVASMRSRRYIRPIQSNIDATSEELFSSSSSIPISRELEQQTTYDPKEPGNRNIYNMIKTIERLKPGTATPDEIENIRQEIPFWKLIDENRKDQELQQLIEEHERVNRRRLQLLKIFDKFPPQATKKKLPQSAFQKTLQPIKEYGKSYASGLNDPPMKNPEKVGNVGPRSSGIGKSHGSLLESSTTATTTSTGFRMTRLLGIDKPSVRTKDLSASRRKGSKFPDPVERSRPIRIPVGKSKKSPSSSSSSRGLAKSHSRGLDLLHRGLKLISTATRFSSFGKSHGTGLDSFKRSEENIRRIHKKPDVPVKSIPGGESSSATGTKKSIGPDSTEARKSSEKDDKHSTQPSKKQIEIRLAEPPFKDMTAKCTLKESMDYYENLAGAIKSMKGSWQCPYVGASPLIKNLKSKIPELQKQEMELIEHDNNRILIDANNAFVSDAFPALYLKICSQYFRENKCRRQNSDVEEIIDYRVVMNTILDIFLKNVKTEIYFPPLKLPLVKMPSEMKRGNRITSDMIPVDLQQYFDDFIGKKMRDGWRTFQGMTITYDDALGLSRQYSMNSKVYHALVKKILFYHKKQSKVFVLRCSEVMKASKSHPITADFDEKTSPKWMKNLKKEIADNKIKRVILPLSNEGLDLFGFATVSVEFSRINIFFPDQDTGTFQEWALLRKYRTDCGFMLQYFKDVMKQVHPVPGNWSAMDGNLNWPWDSDFHLDGNVEKTNDSRNGAIHSLMYFERVLMGNNTPERFTSDEVPIHSDDFRVFLIRLLEDVTS